MSEEPSANTDNVDSGRGSGRGRGRGRDGSGGRGERCTRRLNNRNRVVFKGSIDGMKGNVFQCFGESPDKQQYTKTVEALSGYISTTMDFPKDVASICKKTSLEPVEEPADLSEKEKKSETKKLIWKTKVQTYVRRVEAQERNCQSIYAVIWGQCSTQMKNKLQSLANYDIKSDACDCVWILKEIKAITLRFEGTRYIFLSLDDARSAYYGYAQPSTQSLADYLRDFQSLVDVLDHYNTSVGEDKAFLDKAGVLMEEEEPHVDDSNYAELRLKYNLKKALTARNRSLALSFLKRADKVRYGSLWTELENQYTRGTDQYPKDLTAAYNMLLNYRRQHNGSNRRHGTHIQDEFGDDDNVQTEMSFLQSQAIVAGTDGVIHERTKCFNCNKKGHYVNECPDDTEIEQGVQMMHVVEGYEEDEEYESQYVFVQSDPKYSHIPSTWLLLDSCSTVSVFKTREYVGNIRKGTRTLIALTNGGQQKSKDVADTHHFGQVWFNEESMANILALADVVKHMPELLWIRA